jgi:hypothetical protein
VSEGQKHYQLHERMVEEENQDRLVATTQEPSRIVPEGPERILFYGIKKRLWEYKVGNGRSTPTDVVDCFPDALEVCDAAGDLT